MMLSEMRADLRKKLGNPTTADVADSVLTDTLNTAEADIIARYKFHKGRKLCTFPTVVSQANYGLPTGCVAIIKARNNTNETEIKKAGDNYYEQRVNTDVNGAPLVYIRERDWITLDPIPDAIYSIEIKYVAVPSPMVSDIDTPTLPDPWHRGIILKARHIFWDDKYDTEKAAYSKSVYDEWTATMPTDIEQESEFFDTAVEITSLARATDSRKLDWDHRD